MASIVGRAYVRSRLEIPFMVKENKMLDLAFVATGAIFLFGCVLYTFACDHL